MPKKKKNTEKTILQKRSSAKFEYWTSEEGLEIIEGAILSGDYTIDQICRSIIGISRKTFYEWCKRNKELDKKRLDTQVKKDLQIDSVLFKCCKGYYSEEEVVTKDGFVVTRRVWHEPDARMMQIYYNNREGRLTRKLKGLQSNGGGESPIAIKLTIDDGKSQSIIDLDKDLPIDEVLNDE